MLTFLSLTRLADAATVVADPTGDAEPEFLAELKASLETVAAVAPAEVVAELRASAKVVDGGVGLVVELVLADGSETIRETRVASEASALPQARAMARAAFRELVAPDSPKAAVAAKKPAAPPPTPRSYDRRRLVRMSVWPTLLGSILGPGIFSLGFLAEDEQRHGLFYACVISGSIVTTTALVSGPSIGWFGLGRTARALGMSGLRLALLGAGTALTMVYIFEGGGDCVDVGYEDDDEWRCPDHNETWVALGTVLLAAGVVLAFVDAALVGRAADRANAERRDGNRVSVGVAPVAWAGGKGDATFGLALDGSF